MGNQPLTPDPAIDPVALWLCQLPGMTAALARTLVPRGGSAEAVLRASSRELRALGVPSGLVAQIVAGPRHVPQVAAGLKGLQRLGIRPLSLAAADYPEQLRELDQPPLVVYIQGAWPLPAPLVFVAGSDGLAPKLADQWSKVVGAIRPHVNFAALRADLLPEADPPAVLGVPFGLMLARQRVPSDLWQRVLHRSLTLVSIVPPTAQPDAAAHAPLATTLMALAAAAVFVAPAQDDPLIPVAQGLDKPAFAVGLIPRDPLPAGLRRLRVGQPGVRTLLAALGLRTVGSTTVRQERLF